MPYNKIIITGATGLVGSHLVELIKDDPRFSEIQILTRHLVPGLQNNNRVTQHLTSLEDETSLNQLVKGDVCICAVGTTIKKAGSQERFREIDYGIPMKIAKAASVNGCSHFILVSAIGSDPDSRVFYNKVKGEVERDLTSIKFKSIHFLHPSLLLGERDEKRTGEQFAQKLVPIINFLIPAKYRAIKAKTIAAKIKEIALCDMSGVHHYEGKDLYPAG